MDRRQFVKLSLIGVMAAVLGYPSAAAGARPVKPNILIMIGDDMTWWDCGPYGSSDVKTPNMDRLAEEGMCFDAMFTSTAMCAPTRQQLYTGMYPVRNGAYPNHSQVHEGVKSIAHYLKDLGYRTGLIGKRHFNPPESFPFELVGKKGEDSADDLASIQEFVNRDGIQPYCLIVCSKQPHGPWDKQVEGISYDADEISVPPNLLDCPKTRREMVKYFHEISYLDQQLGNCMKIVDQSGQKENTIILFTSEQGSSFPFGGKWTCYDSGLKTACIVRWPAKVKPGSRSAAMTQYVDVLPTLIEAAGGNPQKIQTGRPAADGNAGFDGKSFMPVLLGKTEKHREYVFGVHTTRGIIKGSECYPIRSVRSGRYKYIWNPNYKAAFHNFATDSVLYRTWREFSKDKPDLAARVDFYQNRPEEELYDLEKDPFELKNLADDPALAKTKAKLRKELDRWMARQGDEGNPTELKALERQRKDRNPDQT